jgi:glycosyl-4,4'-diaponeurosporenoate acyltransferase
VRVVHLPDPVTVLLDVVVWGVIHAGAGYVAHRTSVGRLSRDNWLFRERRFEQQGRLYTRTLRIGRWKDRLPEAGALFAGGISKRHVTASAQGGLERFVVETRRAELAHWLAAAPGVLFVLWNPPAVVPVMIAYGLVVNLPFVAVQRSNRIRAARVVRARAARRALPERASGSTPAAAEARARDRRSRDTRGSSIPYGSAP